MYICMYVEGFTRCTYFEVWFSPPPPPFSTLNLSYYQSQNSSNSIWNFYIVNRWTKYEMNEWRPAIRHIRREISIVTQQIYLNNYVQIYIKFYNERLNLWWWMVTLPCSTSMDIIMKSVFAPGLRGKDFQTWITRHNR